ncbi:hypothetical protein Tsubulata_018810 [Turnera subulata]|uniref:GDSL esterase/lipase n=1 Tax=Turnera subulata TaxID=218843 RepID=A0A9Q0F915_9ROSI|nr:hypothetical protein Tsubulata_018810 [Turnera subulata]
MACLKDSLVLIFVFFVAPNMTSRVDGESQVPCYFIFGDSLSDAGNNNALLTLAKANYPPYGVDFYFGPTGRFTNGLTMVDIIALLVGLNQPIPPFANIATDIEEGVNYASGGAGIRDETGSYFGDHISLTEQLANHRDIISRLTRIIGDEAATQTYLNKCLYTVDMGSNDYIFNYFLPESGTRKLFTPDQFAAQLINQYSQQIRSLYDAGARKIALFGVGRLGCIPFVLASNGITQEIITRAVQLFNGRLVSLVDELNKDLANSKFIYINLTSIQSGFKVLKAGCCPVNNNGLCIPYSMPCPNRDEYTILDCIHPTQATNHVIAATSYNASHPSDAYPFDISHLVQQY